MQRLVRRLHRRGCADPSTPPPRSARRRSARPETASAACYAAIKALYDCEDAGRHLRGQRLHHPGGRRHQRLPMSLGGRSRNPLPWRDDARVSFAARGGGRRRRRVARRPRRRADRDDGRRDHDAVPDQPGRSRSNGRSRATRTRTASSPSATAPTAPAPGRPGCRWCAFPPGRTRPGTFGSGNGQWSNKHAGSLFDLEAGPALRHRADADRSRRRLDDGDDHASERARSRSRPRTRPSRR